MRTAAYGSPSSSAGEMVTPTSRCQPWFVGLGRVDGSRDTRTCRTAGRGSAELHGAGLSWRKVSTLRDLAERLTDCRLSLDVLSGLRRKERAISSASGDPGHRPGTFTGATDQLNRQTVT
jgi:hypothetical protein